MNFFEGFNYIIARVVYVVKQARAPIDGIKLLYGKESDSLEIQNLDKLRVKNVQYCCAEYHHELQIVFIVGIDQTQFNNFTLFLFSECWESILLSLFIDFM